VAFGILVFGLSAPFSGQLMDRFGPRRIVVAGLLVIALSMGSSAMMTELWQLNLLWGALSGVGTGLIGSVLGATVANRWFVAKRGLVTGTFGAATSAGQLIFVRALTALAESYGWRNASWVLAALSLLFLIPAYLLLKDDPAAIGAKPLGAPADWDRTQIAVMAHSLWLAVSASRRR
jgi:sugar phosphate permease